MRHLLINADDCGASPEVNAAIFGLMADGLLRSTTLLANAPAIDAALARCRAFPGVSFGIHLNVTEFAPLSGHPGLAPLLDASGRLCGDPRHLPLTAALQEGIYQEWCAQIETLLQAGVTPSHMDSHHHVHTAPGLLPVVKRLQRRYGIHRVRNTRTLYHPTARLGSRGLLWKKRLWTAVLTLWPPFTRSPRYFTDLDTFVQLEALGRLPAQGTFELMVHPGYPGSVAEEHSLRSHALLRQAAAGDIACGARLISYHQLDES
ncbi:MAG: ChbG/HpnK family deacetylase [Magnetococcus sp. WYHC-3]